MTAFRELSSPLNEGRCSCRCRIIAKLPLQFHIQTLSAHGEYRSAQRFKGQLSVPCEIPFGIGRVFRQFFLHLNTDQTVLRTVWSVTYPNEIAAQPEILTHVSDFAEFCCIQLIKLPGTTDVIADMQVFKDTLCQFIKLLKLVVKKQIAG